MPFGVDEFFAVFARYNAAVWPAQIAAYLAGLAAVAALLRPSRLATASIGWVLAPMWLANGIGYHLLFFAKINGAAYAFAALFVAEALYLFAALGLRSDRRFAVGLDLRSFVAIALIAFAAVLYPAWGVLAGHSYPALPMFGLAPCPTTIFTIGVLLLGRPNPPAGLLVIPILWAAIGGTAAVLLNVPQDYGLWAAGLIALIAIAWPLLPHPARPTGS